jgi:hypothetical protein
VVEVRVWSGKMIDSVQFVLRGEQGYHELPRHGGSGGTVSTFSLEGDEHVERVSGQYGESVTQIVLHTSSGRTSVPYGAGGGAEFSYPAPPGWEIVGASGRAGRLLDALGVVMRPRAPEAGESAEAAAVADPAAVGGSKR